MLRAMIGGRGVSHAIVADALEHGSALVLDCANACDPYAYPDAAPGAFDRVYVVGFDMLTSLPDALGEAPGHLERLGASGLYVTSTRRLFHYRDEAENASVRARAWRLMQRLARRYEVTVAVERGTVDERFARLYAACTEETMGHAVSSQRRVAEELKETLTRYARAMRAEDRAVLERLTSLPFKHIASLSYASSIDAWALYLLSIVLEQEKELERLRTHTGLRSSREEQRTL